MDPPLSSQRDDFELQLATRWPIGDWLDLSIVLGVSGGPDSVALLKALHSLRSEHNATGRFEVAHFNHGWRCDESDQDERFVQHVCDQLDVTLHLAHAEEDVQSEEVARNERLAFLRQVALSRGARYLVLAHTADDVAETILHRIIRGTGLRGLRGIPSRRQLGEAVTIVRPLLWARRSNVLCYLSRIEQPYRTDSSNSDLRYTRNRIRHDLLPHLADQYNPNVVEALLRLGTLASEADTVLQAQVEQTLAQVLRNSSPGSVELDRHDFQQQPEFIQREILAAIWRQQMWPEAALGFEQRGRLVDVIRDGGRTLSPHGIVCEVNESTIRLTAPDDPR